MQKPINSQSNQSPVSISYDQHQIDQSKISKNVITIIKKLKKADFCAYIVGGGVRDLLLGHKPKDFDIVTDAKPEQIRALFKNSRIIGRRFKLIHIYFHREVIEVATFRAPPAIDEPTHSDHEHLSHEGRILRDNIYGTLDDDIWRRDFTLNALYYDPIEDIILDYCSGYKDLKNSVIKVLGIPKTRYIEDPVRMLRALRFKAKLAFNIDSDSLQPITDIDYHDLLDSIPKARIFEEYNKLFLTGHAVSSFENLIEYKLFYKLFPFTATEDLTEQNPQHIDFLKTILENTDKRIHNEQPVNPAFLLAAFLWHPLHLEHKYLKKMTSNKEYNWRVAAHSLLKKQNAELSIPKRFTKVIEDIWHLQRLFNKNNKKSVHKAAHHPKFRAGFDFLVLRSKTEKVDNKILTWWQEYEAANDKKRKELLKNYA